MKYLVIDRTMMQPICGVAEAGGKHFGNLQLLDWRELKDYAKWLGLNGGVDLLDAFEVRLINDGVLFVWPVDDDGEPLHDECDCIDIRHYDTGARMVWKPKLKCEACLGNGHFGVDGCQVDDEDLCPICGGDGWTWGDEFETDAHGNPLHNTMIHWPQGENV